MRIESIKHLKPSTAGPRLLIKTDNGAEIEATQMYTFSNGWTLMLMENYSIDGQNMLLVNRDREISLSNGKPEFTLKPIECPDCIEAKKAAYSDATTPGFFRPYCSKHDPQRGPASA